MACITSPLAAEPKVKSTQKKQSPPQETATRPSIVKFQKATPEEHAAAIAAAEAVSKEVGVALNIEFAEISTDHFLIFTDWDPREYAFLKRNVEASYVAVARQFDLLPRENIFVGKLPIYMFAKQADFKRYAKKIDELDMPDTVDGYFATLRDGTLHMTMWKPTIGKRFKTIAEAERDWAYTLTHEFTHAFVARYRTNQDIPRWLNEGIAEVVANSQFPQEDAWYYAEMMKDNKEVNDLFDDDKKPSGDMYPVMMTMVQSLIRVGPRKFLAYFNSIKDGVEPEQALRDNYHIDNHGLKEAWKKFIVKANSHAI